MSEEDIRARLAMLEALVQFDLRFLEAHRDTPLVVDSGVRVDERTAHESLLDVGRMLAIGGGDLESLVVWRVAELRRAGINASVYMLKLRGEHWMPMVQMPDGSLENLGQRLGSETKSAEGEAKDSAALNGDPDGI